VDAGAEVASQKKGDSLKDYAKNAEILTSMRSVHRRAEGYLDQNILIAEKLATQDTALNRIADAALGARDAIAGALATGRVDTLMAELEGHFRQAAEGMNARYGGKYVFAGGLVDTRPVTATQLSDLTAVPSVSQVFQNDDFIIQNKIDEATTLNTGFLAEQIGTDLFDALRSIQVFEEGASGPFDGLLTDAQRTFLEGELAAFDGIHEDLTRTTAYNGMLQSRVDTAREDLTGRKDSLTGMIGDLTDADVAEAITRLQQAQMSVQASAQVFASLRESSLLNLLR
jgi:flagellar hook-associated protein 3 FlgL